MARARYVEIKSFGYGHGPVPEAEITLDLRTHFKDPHVSPRLRALTGRDRAVVDAVMGTPGIHALVRATVDQVQAFRSGPHAGPVRVVVGCVGGRHRSAVVASAVADRLTRDGVPVVLQHRDINLPVIRRGVTA